MTSELINKYASKLGFLFVCIMIIASGYVTQVLPCQSQVYLQNGMMGKHVIGWLICFCDSLKRFCAFLCVLQFLKQLSVINWQMNTTD